MESYSRTSLKVDEFIESLEMWERVYLWEVINSKESIVEMSEEMSKQTSAFWEKEIDDYQRGR